MKPMFGLHKDSAGRIIGAGAFNHDYDLGTWVRKLKLRDGDSISFGEVTDRAEFAEVEPFTPAFIETPTAPPPEMAGEDNPF